MQSNFLFFLQVVGWIVGYRPNRKFAIDMAGFAVNTAFLLQAGKPKFSVVPYGFLLEVDFLEKLNVTLDDFEPRADNCSRVSEPCSGKRVAYCIS